jgi:MarR family transcriptional regulator, organic hydroperoxide resistance regulator
MEPSAPSIAQAVTDLSGAHLERAWTDFVAAIRCARQPRRDPEGLSLAQFELLRPLLDEQPLRVGQLADAAGVRGPTATRMLDTVERAGLVDRVHSRSDRRHVRVTLTRPGRAAVLEKQEQIERARQEVFASLSPAQQEHVASFLEAMTGVIGRL